MSNAQVELYVRQPGHPERRYLVSSGVTQIGRADDNDVVLSDLGVSRRHARVRLDGERLSVEDLGSGNGTWYRGEEIESQVIADGDEVQIDPFVLLFRYRQGVAPATGPDDEVERTLKAQAQPPDGSPEARLVVLAGHRLASVYPIAGTGLSMGRSESRDVVLFDPGASRNHLRIEARPGGHWLVDLGSANGTYLNGERVREHPLMPGDRIRIGSTEFRMEIPGGSAEQMHREAPLTLPDPQELEPDHAPISPPPRVEASVPRRGPNRMEWAMAIGVLGGLVMVLVTGVVLAQILGGSDSEQRKKKTSYKAIDLVEASDLPDFAQDRMAEGQIRFHEGDYFLAVQNFIKVNEVLKEEDSEYLAALWFERTAYEAIVFEVLRADLLARDQGSAGQKAARKKALKSAREALKQGEGQAEARKAVVQAQSMSNGQDDKELRELKAELDQDLVETTQRPENRDFRARMATQVDEADQLLKAGNYRAAIAIYQSVIDEDVRAETHSYYDAEDGIKVASSRILALKTRAWQRVAAALKDDDDAAAATALREILRVDPDDERAAEQLESLGR